VLAADSMQGFSCANMPIVTPYGAPDIAKVAVYNGFDQSV